MRVCEIDRERSRRKGIFRFFFLEERGRENMVQRWPKERDELIEESRREGEK